MTRFRVEVSEIDQTIVTLASLAEFCESLLTEIDRIAATVSGEWSGAAAASFQALHAEWARGAAEMSAGVQIMHQAASTSSTNYAAAAQSNRGVWG
ncbi:WXG100 family type VII secretion target [Frondihabitans cladoniiphilus]|uniref:ESAT-6-like protein n=1 Tax=Frondihabitans cladoniiphilus TaxID=715785 RepID=A0ABP8VPU9_9MICO